MGHAHQQFLPLQAMDRLAQRPPADAVGTRQFRFGDLAAGRDLAFDDGGLNQAENTARKGFPNPPEDLWGYLIRPT